MERALVKESRLASTLRGTNLRRAARRRAILAGVCFVAGIAILMAVAHQTVVGILGFVVMLVSATIAWPPSGARPADPPDAEHPRRQPARCSTGSAPRGDAATTRRPERGHGDQADRGAQQRGESERARKDRDPPGRPDRRRAPSRSADVVPTTPPGATASGSRSRLVLPFPQPVRRTTSAAATSHDAASTACSRAPTPPRCRSPTSSQRAGHIARGARIAHLSSVEHDPVQCVLGAGRRPRPRWTDRWRPVGLGAEAVPQAAAGWWGDRPDGQPPPRDRRRCRGAPARPVSAPPARRRVRRERRTSPGTSAMPASTSTIPIPPSSASHRTCDPDDDVALVDRSPRLSRTSTADGRLVADPTTGGLTRTSGRWA